MQECRLAAIMLAHRNLCEGRLVLRSENVGGHERRSLCEVDLPLFQNEGYNATDKQNVNKN
jgi:hypothetical protein